MHAEPKEPRFRARGMRWRWFRSTRRRSRWGVLREDDRAVHQFLDTLDAWLRAPTGAGHFRRLIHVRGQFRAVIEAAPRAGLRRWLATRGTRLPASPVAVWLLGWCCVPIDSCRISGLINRKTPPVFVRHYARALYRSHAWSELADLAELHPDDPFVSRLASQGNETSFESRLQRFAEHVDTSHAAEAAGPSRMRLWFAAEFWAGRAARSATLIRAVLERIHRLVHGA